MKKCLQIILVLLLLFMVQEDCFSQKKRKRTSKKKVKVENLTQIELERGKFKYPLSYLRNVKRDSLLLYTSITHQDKSITYAKKSVALSDFDYIKITNKKERFKKSLLWGLGVGTLTYVIAQRRAFTPEGISANGSSGVIEGLNVGLIGFGAGIILYNQVLHKKLSIQDQKKYIARKLKSY